MGATSTPRKSELAYEEKSEVTLDSAHQKISELGIGNQDYPGLFQCADAASNSAQKTYFLLQQLYLTFLILGGLLGVFTPLFSGRTLALTYAIVLTIGLVILLLGRSRNDDQAWFDCRAVAESVKKASWRFMMIAPPLEHNDKPEERFVLELKKIREERPECQKHLASISVNQPSAISGVMIQVRSSDFNDRKRFYIQHRLGDQKSWYSRRAEKNAQSATRWFWGTSGLQCLAVVVAIIQASTGRQGFNLVSVLMTCAAVASAWSQMKRHDELKMTYKLASHELEELEAIAGTIDDEIQFQQFVNQVEDAISREHTLWCARRNAILPRINSVSP